MIHYHGLPITPEAIIPQVMAGAHFFASFANRDRIGAALQVCSSFAVDNGAWPLFTAAQKSGEPTDWRDFYEWLDGIRRLPAFDFAVIPDVIDGTEEANDQLLQEWPFPREIGAPVWHLHESLERLARLRDGFGRVCLGSSGVYAKIGTPAWWERMGEAMAVLCDDRGLPVTKIHGLRMLSAEIVRVFPFKSADSTNLARNVNLDNCWRGTYTPPTKAARAAVLKARIEATHSPEVWTPAELHPSFALTHD